MSFSSDDIKNVATLARLHVDEEKVEKLGQDINNILALVDQLKAVDTTGIEPMAHPMDAVQILRADEVTETDQREKFQACAPATEEGLYLVPKVIE
ncbi:MAG: Asp-tRNA(Asn)/Glu-tRNA(Gln) amidotransferase GatCAB subunit C [Oleiphilus sp.]|nr:MAG: Asp-tRNA(Asn)/Glu-tRNA(Gln) amidotransferase GatCAB subunit C [Oleiphilus sp.]